MPLVRIALKETSKERRALIADCVHDALVQTLNIPAADRFQIITQHDADLMYDRSYLDIERTDGIVIVQVTLSTGRTYEQKAALYRTTAELLSQRAGVRPQDVFISLVEVSKDDWSFGNGIAQYAQPAPESGVRSRMNGLGIELPAGRNPVANFVPVRRFGKYLFVSGHTSNGARGKVGADVSKDEAYRAAREVAIDLIGTLAASGAELDRLRIVKLLGMVNSAPDFTEQPAVINGASDLLVAVFGEENGKHARSAVGVAQLPGNASVEVEALLEIV